MLSYLYENHKWTQLYSLSTLWSGDKIEAPFYGFCKLPFGANLFTVHDRREHFSHAMWQRNATDATVL